MTLKSQPYRVVFWGALYCVRTWVHWKILWYSGEPVWPAPVLEVIFAIYFLPLRTKDTHTGRRADVHWRAWVKRA